VCDMPNTRVEMRRRAVSELKNQIQRALAEHAIDSPEFHIAADPAYQSVDVTFTDGDGMPITTEFSGPELDAMVRGPAPETVAKINRLTGLLERKHPAHKPGHKR
jgi:hypothetical protein